MIDQTFNEALAICTTSKNSPLSCLIVILICVRSVRIIEKHCLAFCWMIKHAAGSTNCLHSCVKKGFSLSTRVYDSLPPTHIINKLMVHMLKRETLKWNMFSSHSSKSDAIFKTCVWKCCFYSVRSEVRFESVDEMGSWVLVIDYVSIYGVNLNAQIPSWPLIWAALTHSLTHAVTELSTSVIIYVNLNEQPPRQTGSIDQRLECEQKAVNRSLVHGKCFIYYLMNKPEGYC